VYVTAVFVTEPSFFRSTDFMKHLLPNQHYLVERLRAGEIPLWNPYVGLGRPFLADLSTEALYPPVLASLVLGPHAGVLLLTVLHFTMGALGMVKLGQVLGFTRLGAWIAAASFVGSGHVLMLMTVGQVIYAWGAMYIPVLFLLAVRMEEEPRVGSVVALAVALALQLLSGHPQVAWLSWLGLGAFLAGRGARGSLRKSARFVAVGLGGLALCLLAAFGLAAVQLGPLFELVGQSNRHTATTAAGTLPWIQWASLLIPARMGNQILPAAYFFVGAPVLLAGAAGLALLDDRNARGLTIVAVLAGLVAVGHNTPVFALLFHVIPGLSSFHFPARAGLLVCFCLSLGMGLFLSRARLTVPSLVVLGLASVLALLVAAAWESLVVHVAPSADTWLRVAMVAVTAAALAWRAGGRRARASVAAIGILTALEIGISSYQFKVFAGGMTFPVEAAIRETLQASGHFDATGVPPRVSVSYLFMRDNSGMIQKYSTFSAYVPLYVERVWVFIHEALGLSVPESPDEYPSHEIFKRGPFPYDSMNLVLGLDLQSGRLQLRTSPDPRAYLAPAVRRVANWQEALALMKSGHDYHGIALLEGVVPQAVPPEAPPTALPRTARIESFSAERIVVETEGPEDALLVVAETWYPGWRAAVDGEGAPCLPVNVWMRGVPVPRGRHRVEMQYHSTYLLTGALVTAATAALLAAALIRGRRTRRGSPALPNAPTGERPSA
jgi:hypothetical protein